MSEAIIQPSHGRSERRASAGVAERLNRFVLAWLAVLEDAAQRRHDRRILAGMSDHDLADIGIGRSEIDRALGSSR